ncbi:phytanoyl-CoA dioxygenase [Umbelopsis sp. AD052]|nr:phytanoyl-CoA dioxygenase [Umbelopsis sp. AD052]
MAPASTLQTSIAQENRHITTKLQSNGFMLDMSDKRLGWLTPTDPHLPTETLREIFEKQGYLFLKGLIPAESALEQRRHFFESYQGTTLLKPDTTPEQGVFSGEDPDAHSDLQINYYHKTTASVYTFAKRDDFLKFCQQSALKEFLLKFFGEEPFLYTRKIIRYNLPGEEHSTAVHIDRTFLRDASPNLVSAWIPLGPATVEMGSLMYLEGSHTIGVDMEDDWKQVNRDLPYEEKINPYNVNMGEGGAIGKDASAIAEKYDRRWLVADYEPGDVILHTPYLIHSACQNQDANKTIRLSTDLRFQPASETISQRWLNDWALGDNL